MDDFMLPADPLLLLAMVPPELDAPMPQDTHFADTNSDTNELAESTNNDDGVNGAEGANKHARLSTEGNSTVPNVGNNPVLFTGNVPPPPRLESLQQYVQNLVSLKKLGDNSVQELKRFASVIHLT